MMKLASYLDVAFEILKFNSEESYQRLFEQFKLFTSSYQLPESVGVEFQIGPATYQDYVTACRLTIWTYGYGNTDLEARNHWAEGLKVVEEFLEDESRTWAGELQKGHRTIS